MAWLGEWVAVPQDVAKCPECGSQLEACVDGWSEGSGHSIDLLCKADEESESAHRFFQSDWQPVTDAVKAWANSPSAALTDAGGKERKESGR